MTILRDLSDSPARELAATTFDRNVVVTAGAGTGKTTLLVDRLVNLLMRNPEPLKITEIAALTFTNKAANEMKLRLRERLQSYLSVRLDRHPRCEIEEKVHGEIKSLIDRYHLAKSEIDLRARDALRHMERSEIGTIHSFAASLLRLYPIEAGLDPQFREDDGVRFERHFEESWAGWLDQELSPHGSRKEDWKAVLRRISLEEVRDLAFSLCSDTVQLNRLMELCRKEEIPEPIRVWLKRLEQRGLDLISHHPEERRQIGKLARASLRVIRQSLQRGELMEGMPEDEKEALLGEKEPSLPKGWSEDDFEEAKGLVRVARRLCQVDDRLTRLLCDLLIPFAEGCREGFVKEGFVSFDGLLVRARNLVRDHLPIREELKQQFKAILIDEFQDTDPIQYEILLYLAEEIDQQAEGWRNVRLIPGKIFVVGDPKQSIYAFRRADIEAYLGVVQEIIKAQKGVECRLTSNFRSHARILNVVNDVFEPLIRPREGLQPPYVAIHPAEPTDADGGAEASPGSFRKVVFRRVETEGEANADLARRLEAESLARWLAEEVLGKAKVQDRDGRAGVVRPGDVAVLLRTLTHVHQYLEPLRRRGIRYVVEGERHFYAVQEVIDAVNLLRAVENPFDRSALVGLLRSSVGGLKDAEIYQLHRGELLDYRVVTRLKEGTNKRLGLIVRDLYEVLHRLHLETRRLPVGEAVSRVFDSLPIRLLAAHSFNGEQAVANLEKIRQQAELMGREGAGTLKEVIAMLQRRVSDVMEEGESALAEENVDAVRILSIHKAKGLEFPVVVLAGCHAAIDRSGGKLVEVYHDWSTDLLGLHVDNFWSLSGIFLDERRRIREEEEQKRVFYVAATRAREHLTVSCAAPSREGRGSFLSMLERAVGDLTSSKGSKIVPTGSGGLEFNVVTGTLQPPRHARGKRRKGQREFDWKAYADLWNRRTTQYDEAVRTPHFLTPTLLREREGRLTEGAPGRAIRRATGGRALLVGELAHRFLQQWDFSTSPKSFRDRLVTFLAHHLKGEAEGPAIQGELEGIFQVFFSSPPYEELRTSKILGREIPLLISWGTQVMEGVMDVLYEREGNLYVADYKTDRIQREDLWQAVKSYRQQAEIYSEAVRRSLQREVTGFKLVLLRLGEAVQVDRG